MSKSFYLFDVSANTIEKDEGASCSKSLAET